MAFGKPRTPLTPEEKVERNRRRAIGLSVAAEAFKQGDPVGRALGMRQQFEQQAQQAEQQKLQSGLNAAIDQMNIPGPQKSLLKLLPPQQQYAVVYGQDTSKDTEFERNIGELNRLKNIPADQLTDTDKRNIRIYEDKLLKTTQPKIYQIVGPNRTGVGLGTYDEFTEGLASGLFPEGSTIVNIPTGTEAPEVSKPEVFSVENKPFADKWQATSTLQQNLQNYTNELEKMDEAALTGTGAGAKFATSVIQNTKGFLNLASKDTKSFYNDAVAKNSYTTLEGNDLTESLEKVSDQFGVNESQVRDLAYLFAAARGQEGRGLSDKDYENALLIVSGGVGKRGKIAVIESVYNRLGGEISNVVDSRIRTLQYLKKNSAKSESSYFEKQIIQLNALKEANPFNPYINPLQQKQGPSVTKDQVKRIRVKI